MIQNLLRCFYRASLAVVVFTACCFLAAPLSAQNPEMQQKMAKIKEAAAQNKQALAQYTWVEQVRISLKGESNRPISRGTST